MRGEREQRAQRQVGAARDELHAISMQLDCERQEHSRRQDEHARVLRQMAQEREALVQQATPTHTSSSL